MIPLEKVPFSSYPLIADPAPSLEDRVDQVSLPFFQRMKERCSWGWNKVVSGIHVASDLISFVFFRIFDLFRPLLGARVEAIWLRIVNIWQSVRAGWREEEHKKEMAILQNKVQKLEENRLEETKKFDKERQTLQQENDFLKRVQNINTEQANGRSKEEEALKQELAHLREENRSLSTSRDLLVQERNILLEQAKNI